MYAVIHTGGKQYKVTEGEILRFEKIPGEVGSPVTFDRVLMFSDGREVSIGRPLVDGAAVEGHIVEQGKAKKILVFKYKRRKRYRRKQGHRQPFTAVKIDSIKAGGSEGAQESGRPDAQKPAAEAAGEKSAEKKAAAPRAQKSADGGQ